MGSIPGVLLNVFLALFMLFVLGLLIFGIRNALHKKLRGNKAGNLLDLLSPIVAIVAGVLICGFLILASYKYIPPARHTAVGVVAKKIHRIAGFKLEAPFFRHF